MRKSVMFFMFCANRSLAAIYACLGDKQKRCDGYKPHIRRRTQSFINVRVVGAVRLNTNRSVQRTLEFVSETRNLAHPRKYLAWQAVPALSTPDRHLYRIEGTPVDSK